jgi:DNA sulfur modification protein DndC
MASKLSEKIDIAISNIVTLYAEDDLPWIIGYSGGKDSTTVLQLVWNAVASIPKDKRTKKIHVISTDTLVENPIVAKWVELSLAKINYASLSKEMNVEAHRLTPKIEDRFWVNLIGKGYPAPRPKFRWCTSRLKINASTEFVRNVATERGEAILFLGTRSEESQARAKVMAKHSGSTRELLSRNSDPRLDRVWIFPPIGDWSSDEVWEYLIENKNPWDHSNLDLFHLYKGATPDAECPLVVDTTTPSCGDSRFGCFVCTLVEKDKSMLAMIQNDEDKKWMIPLSIFREEKLNTSNDFKHRDFRRLDKNINIYKTKEGHALIHGPYKQHYREELLYELLKAQTTIRKNAIEGMEDFELISLEELEEIRRIWVDEKHEIEDSVPRIYKQATGKKYPALDSDERQLFSKEDLEILKSIAASDKDEDGILYQMLREMLHVEQNYRGAYRRHGIFESLEKTLKQHAFLNKEEALEFKLMQIDTSDGIESLIEETTTNVNMMYELNEDIENENQNASD